MCDCYIDKCKECGEEIEMHLSDFDTGRDEVEVYCEAHIPKDRSEGMIWLYGDGKERNKAFVRALTYNAVAHMSGNHPNYSFSEVFGVPEGTMAVTDNSDA